MTITNVLISPWPPRSTRTTQVVTIHCSTTCTTTTPVTAAFGATVSFTYEVGGTSTTVDTATMVNASNAAVAVAWLEAM